MMTLARNPRFSERNYVVVIGNFFFDSAVQILVLEEDDGIVIADRRLDQSLRIVGRRGTNHLQSGRVYKPHLRILRMKRSSMHIAAARTTQHERRWSSPTVVRLRGHVDDLVEGATDEVHELKPIDGT